MTGTGGRSFRGSGTKSSDMIKTLKQLKEDTNKVLDKIKSLPEKPDGAINWGDLYCDEAASVENDSGRRYFYVNICEASPETLLLHRMVRAGLLSLDWGGDVDVRTEW